MKKISILALHLNYGGVERSIITQANMLVEEYDVELAVVYKLTDKPAFLVNPKVKIKYLTNLKPNREEFKLKLKHLNIIGAFIEGLKSLKVLYQKKHSMKNYIIESDSDIIISSRIEFTELLSKYAKDKVTIAEEHRHHNNDKKYIERLKKACINVDYLVNVSKGLNDFYSKIVKSKCLYIPNALDDIPSSCSKLNNKSLISVGRLSSEKGFLDLIDVFSLINKRDNEFTLDIFGDGVEKSKIEERVKEYNLSERVTLHGFQSKDVINKYLAKSSLYLMCSFEESFGLVLIEAASFKVPSIAFDSAKGACEIIDNNKSGILISNRDKEKMANEVIKLIKDNDKLKLFGENARKISLNYSFDKVKKTWLDFMRSL